MLPERFDPTVLLFVPGDRPDRFERARTSGAGAAIIDLEDAVAIDRKAEARELVARYLAENRSTSGIMVRMNGLDTPFAGDDLAMLREAAPVPILVPKAQASTIRQVAETLPNRPLVALIETSRGVTTAESVAAVDGVAALAFGPYDLGAELGSSTSWRAMATYRALTVLAARAHGRLAIDGPMREYADPGAVRRMARRAKALGFDGKLAIHPSQIAPIREAYIPSDDELAEAREIVEAARHSTPAVVRGAMVDPPIVVAAERMLRRAGTPG